MIDNDARKTLNEFLQRKENIIFLEDFYFLKFITELPTKKKLR